MQKRLFRTVLMVVIVLSVMFSQVVIAEGAPESAADEVNAEYLKGIMDMILENQDGRTSDTQLLEGALRGMLETVDPYTTYYTPEEAEQFFGGISGSYEGIGVSIQQLSDYVVIMKVFPGSPAEKAGILPGDRIAEVEGVSMVGASLEAVQSAVMGESGTSVRIGVLRNGHEGILYLDVIRGAIVMSPVTYEIRDGIGYIKIESFSQNASLYMTKALQEMDKNKIDKIVLDLRNNPGGLVHVAAAIAGNFVPWGLVTKLDYYSDFYRDEEYNSYLEKSKYKLAVLVNGMSASASEIVAGAVQDTGAGVLIGTRTYGKAKFQTLIRLLTPAASYQYTKEFGKRVVSEMDLIEYGISPGAHEVIGWTKMTLGVYITPDGRMIDGKGITPDIKVEDYDWVEGIDINSIQKLTAAQDLRKDDMGVDVYNAEKILKLLGYSVDTPDLVLDLKTQEALEKFRAEKALGSGGTLDSATQKALNDELDRMRLEIDKQYAKAVDVLKSRVKARPVIKRVVKPV